MWRRNRGLTCQEVVELVTSYLDDALPRRDHVRFERHIADCPNCREYLKQFELTIAATGSLREDDLDPVVRDTLIAQFGDWRRDRV